MSNQILMADGSWRDDAWRVVRPAPGAGAAADDDVAPGAILPLARFLALAESDRWPPRDPASRRDAEDAAGVWIERECQPIGLACYIAGGDEVVQRGRCAVGEVRVAQRVDLMPG